MKNSLDLVYKIGNYIGILIIANLLWVITVILGLGVTVGAANTALYVVMRKLINETDTVMLHNCHSIYIKALKSNFKQSTIVWIVTLGLISVITINLKYKIIFLGVLFNGILHGLQIVILIQLIFCNVYCYCLMATFKAETKRVVYSSLFIANRHLFTTFTCIAVGIALMVTLKYSNYLTGFILISSYILITNFMFKPILKKYSMKS